MIRKLENLSKQRIIETTIELIDKTGGASSVNLREIARYIGCSAPNIYNYFNGLEELLNTALIHICEDFIKGLQLKSKESDNPEELLVKALEAYIEYAMEYPGRLNFFHFERLGITVTQETDAAATKVGYSMAKLLEHSLEHALPSDKALEVCNILHRYLLGELSEYITGRQKIENKEEYINSLVEYCKKLFYILVDHIS